VTVTGSAFTQVTTVRFGSVRGRGVKVPSAAKLTVIVPAGSAGPVDVRVFGPDGSSPVTPKDQYTYLADTTPPAVTGLAVTATTSGSITLSWTNPSGADYAGVVIRRAAGTTPPVSIGGIPAAPPDTSDDIEGVFDSWLETADIPVVSSILDVKDFGDNISAVVDLYGALTSAYNTCAA
jgi:hypothetical protein